MISTLFAQQPNIALTATPSQSDNRAAPYGASNFNDQYINTATWSWISGSLGSNSWMMYEWTSAQTMDENFVKAFAISQGHYMP